jgi:hypothetical protein
MALEETPVLQHVRLADKLGGLRSINNLMLTKGRLGASCPILALGMDGAR